MPVSTQPSVKEDPEASMTAFSTKSAAEKVVSYMWYTHVLVKINTEEKLRANIATLLEKPFSPESNVGSTTGQPGSNVFHEGSHHILESTDDLTDHLVLWCFNHKILAQLVRSAPVLEHANGYTRILYEVPEPFREDFSRRLYHFLLSKRVADWPLGLQVPTPEEEGRADLQDGGIHLDRDAGFRPDAGVGLGDEVPRPPPPPPQSQVNVHDDERQPSTTTASPWDMRTPSTSTLEGYGSEMERGGHFGTVENPLPMNYFSNWLRSRNGVGPPVDINHELMPPFSSPQLRSIGAPEAFEVSRHWPTLRSWDHPAKGKRDT